MKNNIYKIIAVVCLLCVFTTVKAQEEQKESKGLIWSMFHGLEYRLKAGFNIGGTSPLPLPEEIRKIEGYNPTLAISLEGDIIKWFDPKWGAMIGVRFEDKGMSTKARVKNYFIVMDQRNSDGTISHLEGMFTGYVKTKVKNSYITVPLLALYKVAPRWELKLGPYISFLTTGRFDGSAFDGYIREGDPTGTKTNVTDAVYDFSDDLRKINWGVNFGTEWKAYKHLNIYADLAWGINPVFKKDFNSISFDMYNIYGNFGFGYVF